MRTAIPLLLAAACCWTCTALHAQERLPYNHPGLSGDLGVGLWAWPMPMDWDGDGDLDLVVSCPDTPYKGMYLFENTGNDPKMPLFKASRKVGKGYSNIQVSYVDGLPQVLVPGSEFVDFLGNDFSTTRKVKMPDIKMSEGRVRTRQWKRVDFDGDGDLDLVCGIGFWGEYGWDNAFNEKGEWTRGPLRGYVFIMPNKGRDATPDYEAPYRLQAGGEDVDVYGMPSPNLADFDGDGDLDLLCGEFLDGFTYFENTGSRTEPAYKAGAYLTRDGQKIAMHVQMITPVAVDWDQDGDVDIVCGDEDGRVALVEHTGHIVAGVPQFKQPAFFQQVAEDVKFGALVTPVSVDWDGDGDEDLVCGNTSGNIGFIENLDGGNPPRWARPVLLEAGGKVIHHQAGPNGSIQGPCEAKWGYTTLSVADWNHDGRLDLVVNDIWGKITWYENVGSRKAPRLAAAQPLEVAWEGTPPRPAWNWWNPGGRELVTQWRTTPCVVDWDQDGLQDLLMLDHEGYFAFFQRARRAGSLVLLPGQRIFKGGVFDNKQKSKGGDQDQLLRLNDGEAGRSGRRKLCLVDWDGDGDLDILANSTHVNLMENMGTKGGMTTFKDRGPLGERKLAGHTTSPTTVDWDNNGIPDLLVGAEDGRFYYQPNDRPATGSSTP